jgi:hypothetical protein
MRMEGLKPAQAVHMEMRWHDGLHAAMEFVLDPADQFLGGGVLRRCVEDHHLIAIAYDEPVARDIPEVVGLVERGMDEAMGADPIDDELLGPVNGSIVGVRSLQRGTRPPYTVHGDHQNR